MGDIIGRVLALVGGAVMSRDGVDATRREGVPGVDSRDGGPDEKPR